MAHYAKITVAGSPISKSNFKLWNKDGRAILPNNSGKYHDRYANYEDEIALCARNQNPGVVFSESLIAVLKVYYKSEKRHPDTNNITKSIFDGIEKSGLIVNDAQIRRLIIEEGYDKLNPRFELELFAESVFKMKYEIYRSVDSEVPILYDFQSNKKIVMKSDDSAFHKTSSKKLMEKLNNLENTKPKTTKKNTSATLIDNTNNTAKSLKNRLPDSPVNNPKCSVCGKEIKGKYKKADGGQTAICLKCFNSMF